MSEKENLHAGHRQRIIDRFIANPDATSTHEILEIFLFPFIPRKNTNDIAHRLLITFGSITNVFNASAKELTAVEGIGKTTASNIMVCGKLFKQLLKAEKAKKEPFVWRNYGLDKNLLLEFFENLTKEIVVFFLLDKKHREIMRIIFDDNKDVEVSADIPELTKAIAVNKPYAVLVAHNHPSGITKPSHDDDVSTAKFYTICNLHGVGFADHVIVGKNSSFSYRGSGRIYYIEENFKIEKIFEDMDNIEE